MSTRSAEMTADRQTGLAFSGGGIRSAAFCSGVLRRLLQRETRIDFLSCVSGGGYTGSAYVDWKYRNKNADHPTWHQEFFEHMRKRSGLMCDWQIPLHGIVDTVLIVLLILFVCVLMPFLIWGCYAFPVAYAIDFLFGKLLRAEFKCLDHPTTSIPPKNTVGNGSLPVQGEFRQPDCEIEMGTNAYDLIVLFSVLAGLFVIFFLLSRSQRLSKYCHKLYLLSSTSGLLLAFTFIPFCIQFLFDNTPIWTQLIILFFSFAIWAFFPVLRQKASLVVVVYMYSYFIYWKIYQQSIFGVQYSDTLFYRLMFAFGFVMWINPSLGALQQRLVYLFNRWRLQRAFYTPKSVGKWGCKGIGFEDIFLVSCKVCKGASDMDHERVKWYQSGPLTLGDLRSEMVPQYISNVVVNEWSLDETERRIYELLVMSPTVIERLDRPDGQEQFENKLYPKDIELSAAMATSAAAVAQNMGAYESSTVGFKQLQVVLGLGMGSSLVSDVQTLRKLKWYWEILPVVVEIVLVLPLVTFPLVYFINGEKDEDKMWVAIGVLLFFIMLLVLVFISVLNTGKKNPGTMEKLTRWFVVHVPMVRYLRQMFFVPNRGPAPPPILRLSDGGHIENLAILPLLKKQLPKIVVVDGGHKKTDEEWGSDLLHAFSLAREKLHCSFTGLDGRDVHEDIREKFIDTDGFPPRSYRCKVHYHKNKTKVGEGEILLLTPRHPNGHIDKQKSNIKETTNSGEGETLLLTQPHPNGGIQKSVKWEDVNVDLEAGQWGKGPQQDAEEVDSLTFCCCDCCHGSRCKCLSDEFCGAFPQHSTVNQFFTPRMFSAYHREGYNACMEAEAAEFLGGIQDV
ncbi:uncharacterized protein [Montipora foliosa]|uniref:uncharacterized protein n=1 Tax=Montipora foliosa TaxID=591990 RepID=UPI0035F1FDE6